MPNAAFRDAVAPLFATGQVEAVEWTLDFGFARKLPAFIEMILTAYGERGALYAHGTGYSPLSAGRADVATAWRTAAAEVTAKHRYRHLTEHFGMGAGGEFVDGPPLPVPADPAIVRVGVEKLTRLRDTTGIAVGLENLALGFCRDDAYSQGDMLEALLAPVDGVFHLDLHNLWTLAVNFGLDAVALAERFPLHRARFVHVSGGTWVDGIRRDTHDDRVPVEVWELLTELLPKLPRVEVVVLERIGQAFRGDADATAFREDFERLRVIRG